MTEKHQDEQLGSDQDSTADGGNDLESSSGSVPTSRIEPGQGIASDPDEKPEQGGGVARLSVGLSQSLETATEVEVIIEVADAGFLQVISAELGQLLEPEGSMKAVEDAFPAPYVVARLNAAQVDLISRLEGVLSIEENVVVTADAPAVGGVEKTSESPLLTTESALPGKQSKEKEDGQ